MNRRWYISLFLGVLVLMVFTTPENHNEAEDTYYYARVIEHGNWAEMFHGHHLLYLPASRLIYRAAQLLGFTGRSLPVLLGFSMLSGAFSVCILMALFRCSGVNKGSWPFAASLLFSYGFWRYSAAAEIYIPATALSLAAVFFAVRMQDYPRSFWLAAVFSVAALSMHLICIPAVLLAIPLLYILRRNCLRAATHVVLVSTAVLIIYGLVALGPGLLLFHDTAVFREGWIQPMAWLKGMVAFGQNLLSGNFLFAVPGIADRLTALFPYHMLHEEIFMGVHSPGWVQWLAPVTLTVAGVLFTCLVVLPIKGIRSRFLSFPALLWVGLIWFAGGAAMAMWFEPANPEVWICVLPALWLVLGLLWHHSSGGIRWLPIALAGILAIHNYAGGMLLVQGAEGDYCRQKAEWIVKHAKEDDLVLVADSHSFTTYLQYWSSAHVEDMKFQGLDDWNALKQNAAGKIYVYSCVLDLFPPITRRDPSSVAELRMLGDVLRPQLKCVHKDEFGVIYEWSLP